MHGLEERRIPGNTLAVQPDKPYQGLSMFGTGFLSRCGAGWPVAAGSALARWQQQQGGSAG
jgi:hypothetical protein